MWRYLASHQELVSYLQTGLVVRYEVYKEKMASVFKTKGGLKAGHTIDLRIGGKGTKDGSEMV